MKLDPGQIIDGRFVITTRLGGNQYSSTAKAEAVGEGKEVVLKLLSRDEDLDLQKQLAEAKAIKTFSQRCPELLTIEEVGVVNGNVFQLLPFLPLRSLKRHRLPANENDKRGAGDRKQSYFSEDFQWLVRVANALKFLSQQGRVHGDVKPTNILFSEDNRGNRTAWLSDVEIDILGEPSDDQKVKDEYPGTLQYVSQEVFIDRTARSAKSDQYALAVTLYQWLAGELPYKGTTGIEMYKAFKAGCLPIGEHCPGLPATAAAAIHRALALDPDERFGSATEFVDAFMEEIPSRSFSLAAMPWKQLVGWVPVVAAMALAGFFFVKAAQNMLSRNDTETQNTEVIAKTPDQQNENDKPNQLGPELVVNDQPGKGIPMVQQEQLVPQKGYQGNAIVNQLPDLEQDDRKQGMLGAKNEREQRSGYDPKVATDQSTVEALLQKARQYGTDADNEQSRLKQGDPDACPIKLQSYEDNEFATYEKAAAQGSAEAQKWMGQHYENKAQELYRHRKHDRDGLVQNLLKQSIFAYLANHRDEVERLQAEWKLSEHELNRWTFEYQQIHQQQQQPKTAWPESKPQSTQQPQGGWNQQPPQQNNPQQNSPQQNYPQQNYPQRNYQQRNYQQRNRY